MLHSNKKKTEIGDERQQRERRTVSGQKKRWGVERRDQDGKGRMKDVKKLFLFGLFANLWVFQCFSTVC
jgi:hypothetical protein